MSLPEQANCEVFEAELAQREPEGLEPGGRREPEGLEPGGTGQRGGCLSPMGRPMGWIAEKGVPSRLAVKLYRTGHSSDRGAGAVMREVMWEVHGPPNRTRSDPKPSMLTVGRWPSNPTLTLTLTLTLTSHPHPHPRPHPGPRAPSDLTPSHCAVVRCR